MNRDELLKTLQSLHDELDSTQDVDDATREMLQTVTDDIRGVLEREGESSDEATDADASESLSGRLRETLIEFEARHPQIAGILERLTDGLSNMGI